MTRRLAVASLLALASSAWHPRARADVPPRALEIDVFGGVTKRGGLSVQDDLSTRNGGGAAALGVLYRSRYFLSPFLDFAYYPLSASERVVDLGRGPELVTNRAWTFGFTGGAALDLWRVRLLAGLGAYDLRVSTWSSGERSTVSELDFGYVVGASAFPLVRDRLRVGVEARAGLIVEAQTALASVGLTIGGDAVTF